MRSTGTRAALLGAIFAAAGLLAAASAGVAFAQAGGPQGCDPGERVIRFAHVVVAQGHTKGEAAQELADLVNKELDGRLCMQVYPDSTLYDDSVVLDEMLKGNVELAAPSISKLEDYTKAYRIFDLPFLFRDEEAVEWFQNSGPGQRLRREVSGKGFKALAFWNAGMKQISATKPLLLPTDARGLTFRIQTSDVLKALFEQIGAIPKPMAFKDVAGALETGAVQGQENSWANIYSKGFYKFQDGVTESNHGLLTYLVITSDAFWNSLSVGDRVALNRILVGVTARVNQASQNIARRNREALEREGVPIRKLNAEQRAAWVEAMRPVWDKFARDIGQDYIEAAITSNR